MTNGPFVHIINLACYGKRPNGGVAQLARASGSYPAGRRFKSHRRYHLARWSRGQDTALSRRNHGFDSRTGHQQRDVSNDVPNYFGDLAQLVRAFASHARGHGFESPSLHHRKDIFRKKDVFFCFDRQFRERILSMMNKMIAVSLLIA